MGSVINVLCGAVAAATFGMAVCETAQSAPTTSPLISQRPLSQRPTLMVLGMVHLANPNRDLHDATVDDVLAPERQRQIEAVVGALAAWKPTRVAVEWSHKDQAKLDQRYADYRTGRLQLKADEVDQIGLRLAAKLNLPRVEAVDWLGEFPGVDADYDWQLGAKLGHEEARFAALSDPKISRDLNELVHTNSVARLLRKVKQPEYLADMNRVYYDLALLGGSEVNPGANWVGAWHARNLKILDNLIRLDAKPSERVLLLIGAGHAHLLNEYAPNRHAFRLERPDTWLKRAEGP